MKWILISCIKQLVYSTFVHTCAWSCRSSVSLQYITKYWVRRSSFRESPVWSNLLPIWSWNKRKLTRCNKINNSKYLTHLRWTKTKHEILNQILTQIKTFQILSQNTFPSPLTPVAVLVSGSVPGGDGIEPPPDTLGGWSGRSDSRRPEPVHTGSPPPRTSPTSSCPYPSVIKGTHFKSADKLTSLIKLWSLNLASGYNNLKMITALLMQAKPF